MFQRVGGGGRTFGGLVGANQILIDDSCTEGNAA
jgi:hypothetical protein